MGTSSHIRPYIDIRNFDMAIHVHIKIFITDSLLCNKKRILCKGVMASLFNLRHRSQSVKKES